MVPTNDNCVTDSIWKVILILSNYCQQFFKTVLSAVFRLKSSEEDKLVANPESLNNNGDKFCKTAANRRNDTGEIKKSPLKSFKQIPGPLSLPFVGSMLTIPHKNDLMKSNDCLVEKYGSLVKLEFYFNYPVINVYDADDIERITKFSSYYRPPSQLIALHRSRRRDQYDTIGVAHTNGPEWVAARALLEPQLFNTMYVRNLTKGCMEIADDFMQLFKSRSDGTYDNFGHLVFRFNFECACFLILGKRMEFLNVNSANQLNIFIESCPAYFRSLSFSFTGFPLFAFYPDKVWTDFCENESRMYETWATVAEDLKMRGELDGLLKHIFAAPGDVSYKDRRTLGMDLILGALEPVHNTVIFTVYLIASHEHVAHKLFEELEEVMPTKDCIVDESTLDKAKYLKACIQESYRLMPTAPRLARLVDTDVILQDYQLPAHTLYLCQTWYACLQDSNFYRARDFLPERWMVVERNGKRGMPYSPHTPRLVLNFGIGKRECPGKKFFQVQCIALLAKLFRNYRVEFLDELKTKFEFLLAPAESVPVKLTPRPS